MKKYDVNPLSKVVNGGFCVGCGACAYISGGEMIVNDFGEYIPNEVSTDKLINKEHLQKMEFVCPSLNESYNEDVLAEKFLDNPQTKNESFGFYNSIYGGYVCEDTFRQAGTSGGFGTWIGVELLRKKMIDGIIHVKEQERVLEKDPFFGYEISFTEDSAKEGSKTKYHVVEMSHILNLIREKPGKYLFIGVPCMIKAIRRIQIVDPLIRDSIKYTLSLVCGHFKSINWTLSLGWGTGVGLNELSSFQYRTKGTGIPARAYFFTAFSKTEKKIEDSSNIVGGKFNQGALMLPACNFCDDLVGETADITIGDAWLPKYEIDSLGTNMLIVRNKTIDNLLATAMIEGRIILDKLTEKDVIDAQSGGFRQRREGLSYRLKRMEKKKEWTPDKRVKSNQFSPPLLRRIIYNMRQNVTLNSRNLFVEARNKNNFEIYKNGMIVELKTLRFLEIMSSIYRIIYKRVMYIILKINK